MKHLAKYMKKSVVPILLVVGLLVVQAICDLSLPSYTSDIVNVGIQQQGVESAAPDAIRASSLESLKLFMNADDVKTVERSYQKIESGETSYKDYDSYVKKYPALEKEGIYVRTVKEKDSVDALAKLFAKPMMVLSTLQSDNEQVAAVKKQIAANMPGGASGNIDLVAVLSALPQAQRAQILDSISEKLSAMPDSIMEQSAVSFVKAEYEGLGMDMGKAQNNYIFLTGAKMLLLALASMAATIAVGYLASRIAAGLGRDMRGGVLRKVLSFSNKEMDQFSTASLITRSTNDIQQIQMMLVMLIRVVFYAPIMGVGGVIKVLGTESSMAWIIGVAVLAIMVLVAFMFSVAMPKFKRLQDLVDKLNRVTREILTGLPVIRAFSTEKHEEKRFDGANRDLMRTQLFVNRVMAGMMPVMMLVMNGVTLLIVYNGAYGIDSGSMQVGDMMAFIQYTMQIIMSFLMISMLSVMLPRAAVSMRRVGDVLGTESSILDDEHPVTVADKTGGVVEFRNVNFRYPGANEDVLSEISFTAKPGETTAFIGSTGSGKTTLINLIPRFYDVTEGEILIDGVDVRKMTQHDLHAKMGYVPQQGVLFSGTIASNLKYGKPDATDEEMRKAAEIAQATDFIEGKADKYDAPIAQGATNVSGGQKQRLSIARAITKDPEIYIFDDSFSALDFKTDAALRKALQEETKEKTVLIVAQRISTILHAQQILVLDEGKIVGRGTHQELMKNCEVYQQIALSQLSKEELQDA